MFRSSQSMTNTLKDGIADSKVCLVMIPIFSEVKHQQVSCKND